MFARREALRHDPYRVIISRISLYENNDISRAAEFTGRFRCERVQRGGKQQRHIIIRRQRSYASYCEIIYLFIILYVIRRIAARLVRGKTAIEFELQGYTGVHPLRLG